MASTATLVAVVTAGVEPPGSVWMTNFTTNRILQGNAYDNVYPPSTPEFQVPQFTDTLVDGKTYLVFMSFNRGGACVSALFSYDQTSEVATFIQDDDSPQANGIPLPGRLLQVPQTITLGEVRARMYPTGGELYPEGTQESYCPGP